jgi:speckle-type POZ protein
MDSNGRTLASAYMEFTVESADVDVNRSNSDDFVRTKVFTVGGRRWRIWCYPRGSSDPDYYDGQSDKGLEVKLEFMDVSHEVRVLFTAELADYDDDDDDDRELVRSRRQWAFTFGKERVLKRQGFVDFLTRDDVEKLFGRRNCIKIECTVVVLSDDRIDVAASDLGTQLEALRLQGTGCDVAFGFNDEEQQVHAHRCVMAARSKVFAGMLYGFMPPPGDVVLMRRGGFAHFDALVNFAYKDSLPIDLCQDDDDAVVSLEELLRLSDFYGMDRLKSCCAAKLWDATNGETVSRSLRVAVEAKCDALIEKCIEFIAKGLVNIGDVVTSVDYISANQMNPGIAERLREKAGLHGDN